MIKKIFLLFLLIVLLLLAAFLAPNISKTDKGVEYLLVPQNATLNSILDSLNKKESMYFPFSFYACTRLTGYDKNIQAGRYKLKPGLNNLFLLNNLVKGRQLPLRITFNNIRTKEQLCGRICEQIMLDSATLYKLLNDDSYLEKYNVNSHNSICLFMPNTYEVYWNIPANKLIDKMHASYTNFWNKERIQQAATINLSTTEVMTLASIVEEESNLSKEKPTIAGLYINRLKRRRHLQADPTIKFAIGDFNIKRIRHKHIEASKASPYNTYIYTGLPPGPIRIPSIESINAVLNYERHPYIYMCAKTNGKSGHDFAVSYREHVNNANKYRKAMNILGVK